jgi:hypothetical protein
MTELLKSYLREDRSFDASGWADAEKTYIVDEDIHWTNGELVLEFVGNRVDVIVDDSSSQPVTVEIDGRRPSEFPELTRFTRADWYPESSWLSILKIASDKPLLEEDWTARVLEFNTNSYAPFARFEIVGSKTGYDGEANNWNPFISRSGRVKTETVDWLMLYWAFSYYPILKPLPLDHEIHRMYSLLRLRIQTSRVRSRSRRVSRTANIRSSSPACGLGRFAPFACSIPWRESSRDAPNRRASTVLIAGTTRSS